MLPRSCRCCDRMHIAAPSDISSLMPAKKTVLTEEQRRKRIRETAIKLETSDDPKDFESAFDRVAKKSIVRNPNQ